MTTIYLSEKYRDKIREVQNALFTNDEHKILAEIRQIKGYKRTNIATVQRWMLTLGEKLYTIGNGDDYRKSIAYHGVIYKRGRTENYYGGQVWQTKEAAWKHIYDKGLMFHNSVWEIAETLWGVETEPSSEDYHFLLIDRPILREVE